MLNAWARWWYLRRDVKKMCQFVLVFGALGLFIFTALVPGNEENNAVPKEITAKDSEERIQLMARMNEIARNSGWNYSNWVMNVIGLSKAGNMGNARGIGNKSIIGNTVMNDTVNTNPMSKMSTVNMAIAHKGIRNRIGVGNTNEMGYKAMKNPTKAKKKNSLLIIASTNGTVNTSRRMHFNSENTHILCNNCNKNNSDIPSGSRIRELCSDGSNGCRNRHTTRRKIQYVKINRNKSNTRQDSYSVEQDIKVNIKRRSNNKINDKDNGNKEENGSGEQNSKAKRYTNRNIRNNQENNKIVSFGHILNKHHGNSNVRPNDNHIDLGYGSISIKNMDQTWFK